MNKKGNEDLPWISPEPLLKLMASAGILFRVESFGFFARKGGKIMLLSFALILIGGWVAGKISSKLGLPTLLGMVVWGIFIGPNMWGLLDSQTLLISPVFRQIALVVILTRAGLSLNLRDLKTVGRPALFMSFLPASLEILGVFLLAPMLLGLKGSDAALLGSILAAVSPAVVVPKMIHLIQKGYGTKKGVPQLILAGASVDDVFVIVLFSAFLNLAQGGTLSWMSLLLIPVRIVLGIGLGLLAGYLLSLIFKHFVTRSIDQSLIFLAAAFLLVELENHSSLPLSGLLAVMFAGIMLARVNDQQAEKLAHHYNQLWAGAEIGLFVLVGSILDISQLWQAGPAAAALIFGGLSFRMIGVSLSLLKTPFNRSERFFCMMAYTPKATVQASIGGVPLAVGLASGELILVVAVLSIMLTAPLGAFLIEKSYPKLLTKDKIKV